MSDTWSVTLPFDREQKKKKNKDKKTQASKQQRKKFYTHLASYFVSFSISIAMPHTPYLSSFSHPSLLPRLFLVFHYTQSAIKTNLVIYIHKHQTCILKYVLSSHHTCQESLTRLLVVVDSSHPPTNHFATGLFFFFFSLSFSTVSLSLYTDSLQPLASSGLSSSPKRVRVFLLNLVYTAHFNQKNM